jgi:hypothetical protein
MASLHRMRCAGYRHEVLTTFLRTDEAIAA